MEPWKRNLYSLWATELIAALAISLVLPFLPFYIRELGIQELREVEKWSGFIFAAPFLVSALVTPLWGWLGDRYGRRMMLIRAVFGFAIVHFLSGFAQNVHQFLILRLILGGVAGFISATLAIVSTTTPREHMGYAMGVLQTSLTTGTIIGPFIGGLLADQIGYRHIFFVTGGLGFGAALLVILLVRENPRPADEAAPPGLLANYRFVFTSPVLTSIFAASLAAQMGIMSLQPILSLFVESLWGPGGNLATVAGAVFAVTGFASLLSSTYWGKRGDRMGYKKVLAVTLLGTALTCAPQGLVTQAYQLLLLRFLQGLFLGGILPALYTLTSVNVPQERRGGVLGITRGGVLLGNVFGPVSGGYIAAHFGMRPVFFFTSAMLFLVTYAATRFIRLPAAEASAPDPLRKAPASSRGE